MSSGLFCDSESPMPKELSDYAEKRKSLQLVVKTNLLLVACKARPTCMFNSHEFNEAGVARLLAGEDVFRDVVHREIITAANPKAKQHWFIHRDNLLTFERNMPLLKEADASELVGQLLGYFDPGAEADRKRYAYTYVASFGSIQWYVNTRLLYCEAVRDFALVTSDAIANRLEIYTAALRESGVDIRVKVWQARPTFVALDTDKQPSTSCCVKPEPV